VPNSLVTPKFRDTPPIPANEAERVRTVHDLNQLHSEAQPELAGLRDAAQRLLQIPFAAITLIEGAVQRSVTTRVEPSPQDSLGIAFEGRGKEIPRNCTVCQHTIMEDDHLVVPDLRRFLLDEAAGIYPKPFLDQVRAIQGYPIPWPSLDGKTTLRGAVFYAGVSIRTAAGLNVGTLCVMDVEPRPDFSLEHIDILRELGRLTAKHLELRALVDRPANLRLLERLAQKLQRPPPVDLQGGVRHADAVVLGGGPAGVTAACRLAFHGLDVVLVEPKAAFGGPTGVHSKILREAALHGGPKVLGQDVLAMQDRIAHQETSRIRAMVDRYGVKVLRGLARFVPTAPGVSEDDGGTSLEVMSPDGAPIQMRARVSIVASGSQARRVAGVPYDNVHIVDTDGLAHLQRKPRSLLIQGGGLIGLEYAMIFSRLGVPVAMAIRDARETMLPFLDRRLVNALVEEMSSRGIEVFFETEVADAEVVESPDQAGSRAVKCNLRRKNEVQVRYTDVLLAAVVRTPVEGGLGLELLPQGPVQPEARRGALATDASQRVIGPKPAVFAFGDVTGPPGLASEAVLQAQHAVDAILPVLKLGHPLRSAVIPLAPPPAAGTAAAVAWTLPEIAFVGVTEAAAKKTYGDASIVRGRGHFANTIRGSLANLSDAWFLDLVCLRSSGRILGVHVFGEGAADLIQFGASVVAQERSVFDLQYQAFPAVTLHEVYKVAANAVIETLSRDVQTARAS
jgi:NAD(P) transhydrogenase